MSLWHSPQVAESMKKLEGMMPPTLVFADDGKNGDFGPPPSSAIAVGTMSGFLMRFDGLGFALRHSAAAAGSTTSSTTAAAKAWRKRGEPALRRHSQAPRAATPSAAAM